MIKVRANFPILLHIPHASTLVPDQLRSQFMLSDAELERELIVMTDAHTEALFDLPKADRLVFPVSRLVVDPERFESDEREPMSKVGMGVLYEKTHDGRSLRNVTSREELLERYYRPHHAALAAWCGSAVGQFGSCMIIDCHSFPSKPILCDRDQMNDRPEICIGTDDFHTPEPLQIAAVTSFQQRGFTVEVNRPYSGSIVPAPFLHQSKNVASIMVEVRRDLYMDELTGVRSADYGRTRQRLSDALSCLRHDGWPREG